MKNLPFLIEPIHSSFSLTPTSFTKIHPTTNAPSFQESRPIVSQQSQHQNQNINEKDLKKKIMGMLTKDRDKYFGICEKYINGLAVEEDSDSIKNLMAFIENQEKKHFILNAQFSQRNSKPNEQYGIVRDSSLRKFLSLPTQNNSPFSLNTPKSQNRLSLLSLNTSFLSQRFSRDKIQRLIQLNSIHKNVLNFLQYLKISLQAFAFDEEKCWILMKDEVERHLLKSERNIDKLLELRDQHECDWQLGFEVKKCKSGGKSKHKQKEDIMEVANEVKMNGEKSDVNENTCSDIIKKPQFSDHDNNNRPNKSRQPKGHMPSDYPSSSTFRQYKLELRRTKQRILTLQVQSSNTLKQSLLSWYRKFLQLVVQLKQDLAAVCGWIAKAEKFDERREEKQSIIQFLLINRAKGIEGLVFLQQIYKGVLMNLQTKRREFCSEIEQNMMSKIASLDSSLVCNTVLERNILDQVNTIFFTVQDQLNITNSRISVSTEIEISKVNENQSNESSSMSLVEQCCTQKNGNLRQTQPSLTQFKEQKQKHGLSNIYLTPEKKQKSLIEPKNQVKDNLKENKSEKCQKEDKNSVEDLTAKKSKNIVIKKTIPLIKPFTIGPIGQQNPQEQHSSSLEYLMQQKSDSSKPIPKTPEKKKKPPKPQVQPQVKPQQERHPLDELDDLLVIPYGYFLEQRLDDQKIQMKEVLSGKKQRKNSDQSKIFF